MQFHDTDLSTTVDAAFQALSIDEKRQPFRPAVWNRQPSTVPQDVQQVWTTTPGSCPSERAVPSQRLGAADPQ